MPPPPLRVAGAEAVEQKTDADDDEEEAVYRCENLLEGATATGAATTHPWCKLARDIRIQPLSLDSASMMMAAAGGCAVANTSESREIPTGLL